MQATNPRTAYTIKSITFFVSGSKGNTYVVSVSPETKLMDCSCPDSTFRHRQCKHQRAVAAGRAGKPRVRIQPRPARPERVWEELYA